MMDFFRARTVNIQQNEKIKEGWLVKESKYKKEWRNRWCVLTQTMFYSFKQEKQYVNPTAEIELKSIKSVKTDDSKGENVFKIQMDEEAFFFRANSFSDKEGWIGSIGKAMVKGSHSNLFIADE